MTESSASPTEPAPGPSSTSLGRRPVGASLEPALPGSTDDLALNEMLQILDAASTLRKERTKASLALEDHETKRMLRDRLLEAARVSGDRVTDAEVEAAIERYYATLHAFEPAEAGLERWLAHLYIRRGRIVAIGGGVLVWLGLVWWLFLSGSGPFSSSGRESRALRSAMESIESNHSELTALAIDPGVDAQLDQTLRRARDLEQARSVNELKELDAELDKLGQQLRREFRLLVVSESGELSGVIRDFDGELSGHYLIVEAEGPDGKPVRLPVRSAEFDRVRVVARWGEWVPEAVYNRILADKRADGIVDERLVAEKERGRLELQIRLLGADGAPVELRRQITEWDE